MPFVRRDATGRITAVFTENSESGLEPMVAGDPELAAFLSAAAEGDEMRRSFHESDVGFIRVLEDLIDVLIQKGYVQFSDFPEAARQKLASRQGMRREYTYLQSLFGSGDDDPYSGGGFL